MNPDLNNLGPDFKGHDIRAITAAVTRGVEDRSEFETTTAYNERLKAFPRKVLYGRLTPESDLAFVSDITDSTYDPDQQILNINLGTLPTELIRDVWLRKGRYIGTNGFGASVTVLKSDRYSYWIDFLDTWLFQSPIYKVTMTPSEAASFKRAGRLIFVCRLFKPWISQTFEDYEPTFTAPVEGRAEEDHLYVVAEQLWIYNSRTGRVIHKFVGDEVEKEQPLSLEVTFPISVVRYTVGIDGGTEHSEWATGGTKKFVGENSISLTIENIGPPLEGMVLKLNGKPFVPKWTPEFVTPGGPLRLVTVITRAK